MCCDSHSLEKTHPFPRTHHSSPCFRSDGVYSEGVLFSRDPHRSAFPFVGALLNCLTLVRPEAWRPGEGRTRSCFGTTNETTIRSSGCATSLIDSGPVRKAAYERLIWCFSSPNAVKGQRIGTLRWCASWWRAVSTSTQCRRESVLAEVRQMIKRSVRVYQLRKYLCLCLRVPIR
jgi:hypothetical protein